MPIGLCNAPTSFQNMMNDVLQEFLDRGVICYLDDILIYSRNEKEHEELVFKVLQRLMDHGLAAEIDKCHFNVREVDFLSYILSPNGVEMSNKTVETIQSWEPPTSMKEV